MQVSFQIIKGGENPVLDNLWLIFFSLKMCSKLKTCYFCQNCYVSMQIQHVKKNDYAELHGLLLFSSYYKQIMINDTGLQ